jgi:GT2 family glycosyltransferase
MLFCYDKAMNTPIIPVVICVWHRPNNLPNTIQTLRNQVEVQVRLYIWNNNSEISSEIDKAVTMTDLPVTVIHSDTNLGGFGRFYYANKLANTYKYIVFIDDDQLLHKNALATLWAEAGPNKISGWWAYNFLTSWSY